ncbi:MAG: YggS family pyridoxal phosphate-dependent enzyme [Candidatus Woesearchaeota archaeon]
MPINREIIKEINDLNSSKNQKINLVAVTKNRTIDEIKSLVSLGIKNIAENKIQEAEKKYIELNNKENFFKKNNVKFHFIGHLQKNKVKKAVLMFDVIQSVDSYELAFEINKKASLLNKIQEIFIQVNIGKEKQKKGIEKENLFFLIEKIKEMQNLKLNGLMCIAPFFDDNKKTRPYFREMKELFDKTNKILLKKRKKIEFLSMGMTSDYKIAIEEGSNMIRIGRGLFAD